MKLLFFHLLLASASGFQVGQPFIRTRGSRLQSTVEENASIDVATTVAKVQLLETARSLHDEFGCLIIDSKAQDRLREAVEKLEAVAEPPSAPKELIGNWTLLCSTASASLQNGPLDKINGIDTSKLPFFNEGPLKYIRDTLNKSLKVQQVIRAEAIPGVIDRVDHVLQYVPPDTLAEFLENIPDTLKNLNINPLQVSKSKVSLVHKAEVESTSPLNTKLSLSSIIVNVAGKSQILDPNGADVIGINVPFGEFLNAGSFETTYMDDKIRVSRSKVGIVDQLRVFVKSELEATAADFDIKVEQVGDIIDATIVSGDDDDSNEPEDVSPSDY
mmetsp:Transcript_10048/g.28802  ORF Transcript_10048/g.28802 Transcript_10048/m.28802 type:complete len:330 (+) Transcript_10048:75-1064(+)